MTQTTPTDARAQSANSPQTPPAASASHAAAVTTPRIPRAEPPATSGDTTQSLIPWPRTPRIAPLSSPLMPWSPTRLSPYTPVRRDQLLVGSGPSPDSNRLRPSPSLEERYVILRTQPSEAAVRPSLAQRFQPPFRARPRRLSFGHEGMAQIPPVPRSQELLPAFEELSEDATETSQPNAATRQPQDVYLIDGQTAARFRALPYELQNFSRRTFEYQIHDFPDGLPAHTLAEMLTVLQTIYLGEVTHVEPHWRPDSWALSEGHTDTLTRFLAKLSTTADFLENAEMRHNLLRRVDHLLRVIHTDDAIFNDIILLLEEANTSCVDRTALLMSEVDLTLRILDIKNRFGDLKAAKVELRELGIGLIRLNALRDYVRAYCILQGVEDEEIQYFLLFESTLKDSLNLPTLTNISAFAQFFEVDLNNLDAAYFMARDMSDDPEVCEEFFATWEPWQMLLRQEATLLLAYDQIPVAQQPLPAEQLQALRCSITLNCFEECEQPVLLGQGDHLTLYEYDDLMTWWRKDNRDPANRKPIVLSELYRAP